MNTEDGIVGYNISYDKSCSWLWLHNVKNYLERVATDSEYLSRAIHIFDNNPILSSNIVYETLTH